MADKRVVFGETAAKQIVSAVKRIEASPYFNGRGGKGGPRLWNPGVLEAVVTTAITACSGTTYGVGQVQIKMENAAGTDAIDDVSYPDPVDVKNWLVSSGTVAVGKHVNVGWRNGGWRLISGDCP